MPYEYTSYHDCITQGYILSYKELMDKNKEFYDISRYEINLKNNPTSFYVDEKEKIKDKMIISLRRNNFIEWLTDSDKNKPYHMNRRIK